MPLTVSNFYPHSGPPLTQLTIIGAGFSGPNLQAFVNSDQASIYSNSITDTQFTCIVPDTTSGIVMVSCGGEAAYSLNSFLVTGSSSRLKIASFEPTQGPPGTQVTINGTGFYQPIDVFFGNIQATVVFVASGYVQAVVPHGAITGPIQVSLPTVSKQSKTAFTVT